MKTKAIYLSFLILITVNAFPQKSIKDTLGMLVENPCKCFDSILMLFDTTKLNLDKIGYTKAFYYCTAIKEDVLNSLKKQYPQYDFEELSHLINDVFFDKCKGFSSSLHLYVKLGATSTPTKIKNPRKCKMMKNGVFLDIQSNSKVIISNDTLTTWSHNNEKYAKYKMVWIDQTSFNTFPYESNDPRTQIAINESSHFTVNIIKIHRKTITYQMEYNGIFSLHKFVKIKNCPK